MANNNGIISAPIGLAPDVYGVLGLAAQDGWYNLAYACCNEHGRINKASKIKPVRYDTPAEITPDQMRETDAANGVFYGLQMTYPFSTLPTVHNASFQYYAPRLNVDWCRLTDFNGYDHNATFMPKVTPPKIINISGYGDYKIHVQIFSWLGNGNGVSLAELNNIDYKNMYPCILVSSTDGSQNYAAALKNKVTGTYTPMQYNGEWPYEYESPSFQGVSFFQQEGIRRFTMFFISSLSGSGFDLTNNWREVSSVTPSADIISCPDAANQSVEFVNFGTAGYVNFQVTDVLMESSAIHVIWDSLNAQTDGYSYTYRVQIYRAAINDQGHRELLFSGEKTFAYDGYSASNQQDNLSWNPTDMPDHNSYVYFYEWQAYRGTIQMTNGAGIIEDQTIS